LKEGNRISIVHNISTIADTARKLSFGFGLPPFKTLQNGKTIIALFLQHVPACYAADHMVTDIFVLTNLVLKGIVSQDWGGLLMVSIYCR
jgi:hypothetical protein